jgi:hypothetical protein
MQTHKEVLDLKSEAQRNNDLISKMFKQDIQEIESIEEFLRVKSADMNSP